MTSSHRSPLSCHLQILILQLEQTLLPYRQQWWVQCGTERGTERAEADVEPGPAGNRRRHWSEGASRRASRRSRDNRVCSLLLRSLTRVYAKLSYSIVAIHGIGAHPDDSWCKHVGTAENARWVNWLDEADMLPAVAPHARIMRYGYQSQWFGEGAMRQNASTVAQRLLLALQRERKVHTPNYTCYFC
jgi:hypothetical protein